MTLGKMSSQLSLSNILPRIEIKIFPKLSDTLAERVSRFGLENFYTEEEKTPEHLAAEEERF